VSIGIEGMGYVGLPLAVAFAEAGEQVIGVDVDHGRVTALAAGRSPTMVVLLSPSVQAAILIPVRVMVVGFHA